jgi:hypothetical protein
MRQGPHAGSTYSIWARMKTLGGGRKPSRGLRPDARRKMPCAWPWDRAARQRRRKNHRLSSRLWLTGSTSTRRAGVVQDLGEIRAIGEVCRETSGRDTARGVKHGPDPADGSPARRCGRRGHQNSPQGKGLSAKTVRHIGTLLHTCLADAVRLGLLAANPMADHRVIATNGTSSVFSSIFSPIL